MKDFTFGCLAPILLVIAIWTALYLYMESHFEKSQPRPDTLEATSVYAGDKGRFVFYDLEYDGHRFLTNNEFILHHPSCGCGK